MTARSSRGLYWFLNLRMGGERQSVGAQGGKRGGLSEYQRNFLWKKSYLSESYNPSVGRRYPWAGLRSDQLGITKEPSFISKRRVPYHDPQISKSLEWNGAISENDIVSPKPEATETELQEAEQKEDVNQERVLALEASRVPKRTRSHSTDSRAEGASDIVENNEDVIEGHIPVNENGELEHSTKLLSENVDNGLNRVLRKKAGLTVVPSHDILRNSEYQRQFVWKTPKEAAPVFTANQVFHNKSKFVPQFKGNSIIHETEYRRNFKGLSPVKEPKLRNDLRENGNFETVSPEKKKESRAIALLTSPAAGIKTVDPLPLREDSEISIPRRAEVALPVSKIPEYPANTPGQSPSPPCAPSYWHPSRRIQGSLRDPEFQHNVGKARMNNFQLPQHEVFNDEDEDRLSEISARSAASSLQAFQTLARAQKRKENFWGKT
uniref:nuclear protein MDM1 n=1 Tax=Panthera onca TaxID=9690 RepID=UPI002953B6E6|nr:nuclear protein MDM1 [Panthera onca]